MRIPVVFLVGTLLAGCQSAGPEDEGISFERNSQFSAQYLRVYLNLQDGLPVSVNTLDDAESTESFETPIPGHRAQAWRFLKDEDHGTSLAYAAVSWDPDDPSDYLMAGWWAYFPDQHPPELDPFDAVEYSIIDGPEFDLAHPPEVPVTGTVSYAGLAGGVYAYVPGATAEEGHFVFDGWEGLATLSADFGEGTVSGCIGCVGDLTVRTAVAPASRGEVQHDISDYELHLLEHPIGTGLFDGAAAEVRHPPTRGVTFSDGRWGGFFSNRPDTVGNPRIFAGFGVSYFEEADGSVGQLLGSFVGLSEDFREQ